MNNLSSENQEQKHPQASNDRQIVDKMLTAPNTDYNLVELARLKIRYQNFPGARDIQRDLEEILRKWGLTEEKLYQLTRQIHSEGKIYLSSSEGEETQDWKMDTN